MLYFFILLVLFAWHRKKKVTLILSCGDIKADYFLFLLSTSVNLLCTFFRVQFLLLRLSKGLWIKSRVEQISMLNTTYKNIWHHAAFTFRMITFSFFPSWHCVIKLFICWFEDLASYRHFRLVRKKTLAVCLLSSCSHPVCYVVQSPPSSPRVVYLFLSENTDMALISALSVWISNI